MPDKENINIPKPIGITRAGEKTHPTLHKTDRPCALSGKIFLPCAIKKYDVAYEVGKALRYEILRRGINPGVVENLKNIFSNHSKETLTYFLKGLMKHDESV
ncbi:MAG: hypothetical protein A2Y97_07770 [Nitrospirae bacterium RBG_13_39_12]|nr:MAG: hypothetical protein A2Y97_07770 [Nitrospirae bacterium RBG_13_39_12]